MRQDYPRRLLTPIFGSSGRVPEVVTHPKFCDGVLLSGVAENPFPILRALAYTTGLGLDSTRGVYVPRM